MSVNRRDFLRNAAGASALNLSSPDTSMPELPVIAEPLIDPCTLWDIFESDPAGTSSIPVVNTAKAMKVATEFSNNGQDNETYDFYLLMKSDRMQGWTLPEGLIEK
jgi:hypothetical protein